MLTVTQGQYIVKQGLDVAGALATGLRRHRISRTTPSSERNPLMEIMAARSGRRARRHAMLAGQRDHLTPRSEKSAKFCKRLR